MIDLDIDSSIDFKIDLDLLDRIASRYSSRNIELTVVDNERIREINLDFRGIDKATDVLSFPIDNDEVLNEYMPLGDIVISKDFVSLKAKEFSHKESEEFILLFIHGLLHLVGFDHEEDLGEMREEEIKLIEKFNLPSSLIVRS